MNPELMQPSAPEEAVRERSETDPAFETLDSIDAYVRSEYPDRSAEEINATVDAIVVDEAEDRIASEDTTERIDEAVGLAVVRGVEEGPAVPSNPVGALERDGYGAELDSVIANYGRTDVRTRGGASVAESAARLIDELQASPVMADRTGRLEYLDAPTPEAPRPSLSTEIGELAETLRPKIDRAVDASEFVRSPELQGAIEGYYKDHYGFAAIAERIVNRTLDPAETARIHDGAYDGQNVALNATLRQAAAAEGDRTLQLRTLFVGANAFLFNEVCVGGDTAGEDETDVAFALQESILTAAEEDGAGYVSDRDDPRYETRVNWNERGPGRIGATAAGLYGDADPVRTRTQIADGIAGLGDTLYADARSAGQLEFHNTPFVKELALDNFTLRTRKNQQAEHGSFRAVTAAHETHSQSLHFSEHFMADEYKQPDASRQTVEAGALAATVAIPLAEVVASAPYARGGEYGVLDLKSDEPRVTVAEDATSLASETGSKWNAGEDDNAPGVWGADRTFYADPRDRKKGEDYAVSFGGDAAANAKIIVLDRDLDRAWQARMEQGDARPPENLYNFGAGYGYPETVVLPYDYEKFASEGEPFVPQAGRDYFERAGTALTDPRHDRVRTEHRSYRGGVTPAGQHAELATTIASLQRQSRERYGRRTVVRLRGDVMAFDSRA